MKSITLLVCGIVLMGHAAFAGEPAKKEMGVAQIHGTAEGSSIAGTATFEDVKGGLKVTVNITGLTGDKHALHIHEFGDCGDAGKAAGSHYNPDNAPHGDAMKDAKHAHPGDMGNVTVKDGAIILEAVLPQAALTHGKHKVAGRSIVLHEKADDFSQPVGNAGARIACGVISIVAGK
jgi:Cu-Zn family superoxide dismutase